jgi:plasmid maintenance system antidote protein VapI
MPGLNSSDFGRIPGVTTKSQSALAEELGTQKSVVSAIKSGHRALSVDLARSVATKSGEKPANLYLASQLKTLRAKLARKEISPAGVLTNCQHIMSAVKGQFRSNEFDRSDPDFVRAAEELKRIAEVALDFAEDEDKQFGPLAGSGNDQGPTYVTGDSTAAATKAATKKPARDAYGRLLFDHGDRVERDAYGKAMPEGEDVERDTYGRRVR